MAQARNDLRLRLVFSGECLPGHDPLAVRQAVAAALKLSTKHAERLFSGKHIVLKQQVDSAYAAKQIARFAAMGAVLRTEQQRPTPKPQASPTLQRAPNPLSPLKSMLGAILAWRGPQDHRSLWLIGALVLVVSAVGVSVMGWGHEDAAAPLAGPAGSRFSTQAVPAVDAPLASPSSQVADDGLPRQLSAPAAQDYRQKYFPAAWHKAFVVAATGAHVWVVGAASPTQARDAALKRCAQALQLAVGDCRVVDVDGEPQD